MIKRLIRMYQLSKKDPKALKVLENLTEEQLAIVPDEAPAEKAEFFGEGTDDEYKEQKDEDSGMKPWFDRIKNL